MRLVEHFTSVSGQYISDRTDLDRFAEMLLLVEVQLGRALPVRPRLNHYRSKRLEAMQVFMQDLEQALVGLMPDASRETTIDGGEL